VFSQINKGLKYGVQAGLQFNSATLPDIKLNDNINAVLNGEDIAKGVPQWADLTFNYRLGSFVKYDHGFGFGLFEINFTTAKIKKDVIFTTLDVFGNESITLTSLERYFTYLDFALSYNINLSDTFSVGLGGSPSLLLSNSGKENPNKSDLRAFFGFGWHLNNNFSINTQAELSLYEVYNGSYIHHLMIPVVLQFNF
jgi:hypothetical protein